MAKKESINEKTEQKEQEKTEGAPVPEEASAFADELSEAKKSADEFKGMAQRIQAEFDNYRKRNAEAVRNARLDGTDDVISALLPVIDNFERGMDAVEGSARTGIELIYKQVMSVLEKFEVREIEALGQEFDPKYHHAIAKCDDEERANTVVEVFQKGYIRKNKVLRPSMVKVAQ